jgi:hypothetical protein
MAEPVNPHELRHAVITLGLDAGGGAEPDGTKAAVRTLILDEVVRKVCEPIV